MRVSLNQEKCSSPQENSSHQGNLPDLHRRMLAKACQYCGSRGSCINQSTYFVDSKSNVRARQSQVLEVITNHATIQIIIAAKSVYISSFSFLFSNHTDGTDLWDRYRLGPPPIPLKKKKIGKIKIQPTGPYEQFFWTLTHAYKSF